MNGFANEPAQADAEVAADKWSSLLPTRSQTSLAGVASHRCAVVSHRFGLSFVLHSEGQCRLPCPLVVDDSRKLAHMAGTLPKVLGVGHYHPPGRARISAAGSVVKRSVSSVPLRRLAGFFHEARREPVHSLIRLPQARVSVPHKRKSCPEGRPGLKRIESNLADSRPSRVANPAGSSCVRPGVTSRAMRNASTKTKSHAKGEASNDEDQQRAHSL